MENTAITLISVGLVFMKYSVLSSRDSSVGIATRHGLDGPGIESRWRRDFPHPYRPALVSTQPLIQMDTGSFPGVKRPHPPSSAEVKERVELYVYPPSGPL